MRNLYITTLAVIVSITFGYSQTNKSLIRSGDAQMEMENYASAVYFYSQVFNKSTARSEGLTYHPYSVNTYNRPSAQSGPKEFLPPIKPKNEDELNALHKLSDAYRLAKDYGNAEKWYAVAMENPKEEFHYVEYFYGYSLMKNAKYSEAKVAFEKMIVKLENEENMFRQLSLDKIGNCDFAIEDEGTHSNASIRMLDTIINSGSTSFGMMYHKNGLLFSTAKIDSTLPQDYKAALDSYNSDVYLTEKDVAGNFSPPKWFEGNVNSPSMEGGATLSQDGKAMYFTRVNPENQSETAIYVSRHFNGRWTEPYKLGSNVNVEGFKSTTPTIADDKITLYYSSNRPGGYGGMDIWVTTITEDGETTEPINLGENVNTKEDEVTPFYHSDSKTLYFSSEGHIGFGGLDVFKTTINQISERWDKPINAGKPINSSRDDSYFIWGDDMDNGYLSSDRDNCLDCDSEKPLNIHCNSIYEVSRPLIEITIRGFIYDIDTDEIIPDATIEFKDIRGAVDIFSVKSNEKGYYEKTLLVNEEYFIKSSKRKYFADAQLINTLGLVESTDINQDFFLALIPEGEIEIKGIEYDFDASTLREQSKNELDKLVDFLNLNANLRVEIRSHTDERGRDAYNLKLSQRRAQSVVDYLIEHGIEKKRLMSEGLGETQPAIIPIKGVDTELNPKFIYGIADEDLQEEYHQRNRRTAFKVIAE